MREVWYPANSEKHKQAVKENKRKRRAILVEYVDEIKTKPCADCKKCFPSICMDFDHLPGQGKMNTISYIVNTPMTLDKLMAELLKCELVCSNCHRLRTARRRKNKAG